MSDVAGRMRILVVDDHPRATRDSGGGRRTRSIYGFTVMFSTD